MGKITNYSVLYFLLRSFDELLWKSPSLNFPLYPENKADISLSFLVLYPFLAPERSPLSSVSLVTDSCFSYTVDSAGPLSSSQW